MSPSSPRTPRHSRHTSTVSIPASPYDQLERRNSQASLNYPNSPNNRHSLARSDSIGNDVFSPAPGAEASNGLGNLADELADAWDEDEEEEVDMNFQDAGKLVEGETRDSGVDINSSPVRRQEKLAPPTSNGHRRKGSEYDGSDYGEDSDLDSPGALPPGLVARMDQVESLVRRGVENNGSERDAVVQRVIEGLRDLGGQSNVESGTTRLSTAHSALSTNLHHQSRLLQSLAYPLFSPLTLPPPEEFIDDLLPLLITLSESLPRPTTTSLNSLTQLHGLTADVIQTLNYLSDTLHMSRQTTTTATRRLKSAKELVAEMRKEEEEREQGERWLEKENWGERLQKRECAGVCRDVVGGFEKVCEGWRERLVQQAEAVGTAS